MEQLLRTQMQARYGPERLGHFGLALATYAHFTSPIRRYADLLVHRALVSAYRLGDGGLPPGEAERFEQIGEQISMLERRAMEAERDTVDRYVAAYLADRVGQMVECRITGVQPFGFFAAVDGPRRRRAGASPRISAANISATTKRRGRWSATRRGETYRVGQRLTLRLAEANPVSRLAALRDSGRQLRRRRRPAAPGPRPGPARSARPAGEHSPPVAAALTAVRNLRRRDELGCTAGGRHGLQDRDHRRQPSRRTASTARSRDRSARYAATISIAR